MLLLLSPVAKYTTEESLPEGRLGENLYCSACKERILCKPHSVTCAVISTADAGDTNFRRQTSANLQGSSVYHSGRDYLDKFFYPILVPTLSSNGDVICSIVIIKRSVHFHETFV